MIDSKRRKERELPDSEDRGKLFGLRSQVSDPDKFKLTRTSWRGC